ncbi:MAG: condensation domain-containing protein [Burkholderiaceae bacterium]
MLPLSDAQERYVRLHAIRPHTSVCNMTVAFDVHGVWNIDCWHEAWEILSARHPLLRAGVEQTMSGSLRFRLCESVAKCVDVLDAVSAVEEWKEYVNNVAEDSHFDEMIVTRAPMWRARAIPNGSTRFGLAVALTDAVPVIVRTSSSR